ncbi:MAG: hypothetical protein H0V82_03385 [Candidatus Protochlamydia sp.]|nr:hypothetical protein [Candidatus Protochlamydia sp.]
MDSLSRGRLITPPCDDNFTTEQKQLWSDNLSDIFEYAIKRTQIEPNVISHFFNPTKKALEDDAQPAEVSWIAFPNQVKVDHPTNNKRWKVADGINKNLNPDQQGRYVQDEYCEWSVEKDPTTLKIKRITFTCEGPEYWEFLAKQDPQKMLNLYRQHISPDIKMEDLMSDGEYNPKNKWNNSTTNGAMHLIQNNNSLGAEIILGGDATVLREKNGQPVDDQKKLIKCSRYGGENRNSDPLIGFTVNQTVRKTHAYITFQNPVGLFFHSLNTAGWVTPDSSDPHNYWKYTRGTSDRPVRAVYEVPSEKGFLVGDIKINGEAIRFGGQIADGIKIKLTAMAERFNQDTPKSFPCKETQPKPTTTMTLAIEKEDIGYSTRYS